ncbi:MAG TPA: HD-GYP domain-containing protein [Ruminiclostridium sp.]
MDKMKVSIQQCSSGEILAQDILNDKGIILVAKNTQMNSFIKQKLLEWGQSEVSVYKTPSGEVLLKTDRNEQVRESYATAIRSIKSIISKLSSGIAVDYGEVLSLSSFVFDHINENNSAIKYLNEVKNYDDYTYTHCLNTAFYCMLISRWMKMSEAEIKIAIQAGLLHDIGKTDIPKEILNKKGNLTAEEFELIKEHTTYGYIKMDSFVGSPLIPEEVKKAVLQHHERIDGSGYPFGKTTEDINLFAKMVSVSDVFDAMTSDRAYKKRSSPFDVFEMFKTVGISMFDTDIINIFIKNIAPYYIDAEVLLSDGSLGTIVFVPPHDITRPIVKVNFRYLDLSKEESIKLMRII